MSTHPEKWIAGHEGKPRIFDIDTKAVDRESTWVRVCRRILNRGIEKDELFFALNDHPSTRLGARSAQPGTTFFKGLKDLPMILQERIAILKMADAGVAIPCVGKRWPHVVPSAPSWARIDDDGFRFFTIEVDCEAIHDAIRSR